MQGSVANANLNTSFEIVHQSAIELARIQVSIQKSRGIRSDLVGIKAMSVLSGLNGDKAVMPTIQAIRCVNIVMGQAPGLQGKKKGAR